MSLKNIFSLYQIYNDKGKLVNLSKSMLGQELLRDVLRHRSQLTRQQQEKLRKLGYIDPQAATISEVLKWFEKKHKLFASIHQGIDSRNELILKHPARPIYRKVPIRTYYSWSIDDCISGNTLHALDSVKHHFKTSAEAEKDALAYLLKNLKAYKKQQLWYIKIEKKHRKHKHK